MYTQVIVRKKRSVGVMLWCLLLLLAMLSLIGNMRIRAQAELAPVEEVRTLFPAEWGVPHPVGVTFSDDFEQLHLLDSTTADGTTIVTITPFEDLVGSANVDFALANPINVAYDDIGERLFLLDTARAELAQLQVEAQGLVDAATLTRFDATRFNLTSAQGMAADAARERLFILDGAAARIVNLALDAELNLAEAPFTTIELGHLGATDLRGIAVHPASHNLFVASPAAAVLYELTPTGQAVAQYDLSSLELTNPQGMVFGRSTDLTDRAETIHLFLADSGLAPAQARINSAGIAADTHRLYLPVSLASHDPVAAAIAPVHASQATSGQVNGKLLEVVLNPVRCHCTTPTASPAPTITPSLTPPVTLTPSLMLTSVFTPTLP